MSETIKIIEGEQRTSKFSKSKIGERTLAYMEGNDKLDENGKITVISEAQNILGHCIAPGTKGHITNIAVGYIQSGKTMSYTTLSTLAADNGFRIIIYLTGITTPLEKQTYDRINNDLHVNEGEFYTIFEDKGKYDKSDELKVFQYLSFSKETTLLFPIMKHYQHINRLAEMFDKPKFHELLKEIGVLIVDDEADQASFNTYAKKNASKKDWEVDDFSKTYSSIISLRTVFPCLSYIQYTATPQAAFLIDNNDVLSPKFHTVLSPGKGYTGGKFFFDNEKYNLVKIIPSSPIDEVYDLKRNNLSVMPSSLISALMQFLLSVAIVVFHQRKIKFLSMMVHPDGFNASNEKFYGWISNKINSWLTIINSKPGDPAKNVLLGKFKTEFEEITKYVENPPSFEETVHHLGQVLLRTQLHLVQDGSSIKVEAEKKIDWNMAPSHILVGANILNRGFTVEHLSMTYMPRTSKGKATADTIEQRCRFFGYKMAYIAVCRVYLSKKSLDEFREYVTHEEMLRDYLKQCSSIFDISKNVTVMGLSDMLNPTRTNILSKKLIRGKMVGWRTFGSIDFMDENKEVVKGLLKDYDGKFTVFNPSQNDKMRKHRYIKISVDDFLKYFDKVQFADLPNITRKIVTKQYLEYLKENKKQDFVYLFEMSYELNKDELRTRQFKDNKPVNLMMGYNPDRTLPADADFKFEDAITFQLHHIRVKNEGRLHNRDLYNFTVYYPEQFSEGFVAINQED